MTLNNSTQSTTKPLFYKGEDAFLRNLAMGFCGELYAAQYMRRFGHDFQFDGYGAGTIEIFEDIEAKRKRTPDLVCSRCQRRLEVRSKGKLQISMSDSAQRPFDSEMAPDDWIGFVRVERRPGATNVHNPASYVASSELYIVQSATLSATRSQAHRPPRKSEVKGFESYLVWPTTVSCATGTVQLIDKAERRIHILTPSGAVRQIAVPEGHYLYNGLSEGSQVQAGRTILTGIARPVLLREMTCPGIN